MRKPILFSFFSGLGFLDLGFEKQGCTIAYVNEIYPPFLNAYKYSREKLCLASPLYGYCSESIEQFVAGPLSMRVAELITDARRQTNRDSLIGFIGGPPCPDFSIGGKNRGFRGDNGRLSLSYIECICQHQPDFFLFENVKGLWHTKRHRAFYDELKRRLQAQGYYITEKLINAIEYCVPQDRERIILLGFSQQIENEFQTYDLNGSKVLSDNIFPWLKYATYPDRKAFDFPWPSTDLFEQDSETSVPKGAPQELTVEYWFRRNNVANHPNTEHYFKPRAGLARFRTVSEGDDSRKSFKRLHRWRYSPTACYGNNEVHLHPYKSRRISAAEALAIQSLPKDFELPAGMTLTDMFKGIGNGVPHLASNALAQTILYFLGCINENDGV